MMQYLPTAGCKWLKQDKIKKHVAKMIHENDKDGCVLNVDLDYVEELHDLHNDYSLVQENIDLKEYVI